MAPTRAATVLTVFMAQAAHHHRESEKIVVIWDNLNIHHWGKDQDSDFRP